VVISTVAGLIRHLFESNSLQYFVRDTRSSTTRIRTHYCVRNTRSSTTRITTHYCGLQQHVSDSTRTTPSTSSLLDLVINGAVSRRFFKVAVLPTHGVLDHALVTWLVTWCVGSRPGHVARDCRDEFSSMCTAFAG